MIKLNSGKLVIIAFALIVVIVLAFVPIPNHPDKPQPDNTLESGIGVNWTLAADNPGFSPRNQFSAVVFHDKIWVIGGFDNDLGYRNDVWFSENGRDWILANASLDFLTGRLNPGVMVFRDKIWVSGGSDGKGGATGDIWSSDDGIIWTQETPMAEFGPRMGHTPIVFHDMVWIMGGMRSPAAGPSFLRDVWYSADGVSWQQATPQIAFIPLFHQNLVVLDNKIWDIGVVFSRSENGDAVEYNEIWRSGNGRDWSRVTSNAPFPARSKPGYGIYEEKIWIIGGVTANSSFLSDVWYSPDGISWKQATPSAGFSENGNEYSLPILVIFNDNLWVIRTYSEANTFKNDVWYSGS